MKFVKSLFLCMYNKKNTENLNHYKLTELFKTVTCGFPCISLMCALRNIVQIGQYIFCCLVNLLIKPCHLSVCLVH